MEQKMALATKANKKPPKVSGWPLVGSLPQLARKHLDFLLEMRATHGDIYTLDFGKTEVTIFGHPRHAQHILQDNAENYQEKGGDKGFRVGHYPLMSKGLAVTSNKSSWRQQRRNIQPYFDHKHAAYVTKLMIEAIDESLINSEGTLQISKPIDIANEITAITMNMIGKTIFGIEITSDEAHHIAEAVRQIMDYTWQGTLATILPKSIILPGQRAYQQAIEIIHQSVSELVDRSAQQDKAADSLLGKLRQASGANGDEATFKAYLQLEAITLLITGYESIAANISWTFYLLTHHPVIMGKLQTEIDTVLGGKQPTFTDITHLKYARMIIKESLRLYAPGYWTQRQAKEADEIDGYHIPAGMIVTPIFHLIHHHPQVWEQPEQFEPERFAPEHSGKRHKLAWIPFGAGQRMCLAEEFSLVGGQLVLVKILQRYQVEAVPGWTLKTQVATNLRPKEGVLVKLEKRVMQ